MGNAKQEGRKEAMEFVQAATGDGLEIVESDKIDEAPTRFEGHAANDYVEGYNELINEWILDP
jgi:hypothetical protein